MSEPTNIADMPLKLVTASPREMRCKAIRAFGKPYTDWKPSPLRDHRLVPDVLADAFRDCRFGASPWPLFVFGGAGVGKSRFGMLVRDWYGGCYCDFADLLAEYVLIRRGLLVADDAHFWPESGTYNINEGRWIQGLRTPRMFILDDIGRKSDTEAGTAVDLLTRFLDVRDGHPTVVISNHDIPKLAEVYEDDRVISRLSAGSACEVVGPDMRVQS